MNFLKPFLYVIVLSGCSVVTPHNPPVQSPSIRYEMWKAELLGKCVDKAHELTYLVWQDNKELDVEQLSYIEKRFQDMCVVDNNLAI